MSFLYRQYVKTVAKWPLDELKSHSRNLKNFLEVDIEKKFKINAKGQRCLENDKEVQLYGKKLKALQQLVNNEFLNSYSNSAFKSGHMGLTLSQLRQLNSEEGRSQIGIVRKNKSFWKKLFKK